MVHRMKLTFKVSFRSKNLASSHLDSLHKSLLLWPVVVVLVIASVFVIASVLPTSL